MPAYNYKCNSCGHTFVARHSMSYNEQQCVACDSIDVFRVPSLLEKSKINTKKQVGKIVDKYIEDTKREVRKEKLNRKEL